VVDNEAEEVLAGFLVSDGPGVLAVFCFLIIGV